MMAFALSIKTLKYRNAIAAYSNFTIIFSAGMIPWYIVCVNYLHLSNNILGLICPYLLSVWNLFLLRSYFQAIPDSIIESAKIDGANYLQIFAKIAVPVTSTGLLTIGMMYALQYWNDWWLAIMFITKRDLFPLQYYLFNIMSNVQALTSGRVSNIGSKISLPTETVKMAVTVVTIGPIIFIYPFIQRYFVKGIMTGAVKG
jgi:putative aldouronate transport system permease protein